MPRDFTVGRPELRLVTKDQRTAIDLFRNFPPTGRRRRRIMVAGDPDEARASRQALEGDAVGLRQPGNGIAIMEGVAEANDGSRPYRID